MEPVTKSITSTTVMLPRFGKAVYRESDVIEFRWGLPGFPGLRRWLFLTLESQPSFVWLQSLDDLAVALPTANPWLIFEEYDPKLPAAAFLALGIGRAEEFTLLCVVVVSDGAAEMTMNLRAPILVNLRARKAQQVLLDASDYSERAPVPRKQKECA